MSHLDGVHYGYDEITSNLNIPLSYIPGQWGEKTILVAKDEYPRHNPIESTYEPEITARPLVKDLVNHYDGGLRNSEILAKKDTTERFGMRINPNIKKISNDINTYISSTILSLDRMPIIEYIMICLLVCILSSICKIGLLIGESIYYNIIHMIKVW